MEKEAAARETEAARHAWEQQTASLTAATELLQQQLTAEQQATGHPHHGARAVCAT